MQVEIQLPRGSNERFRNKPILPNDLSRAVRRNTFILCGGPVHEWLLMRKRVCRAEIAKPSLPSSPRACSTRRTCPTASTRVWGSKPGSTGRKILKLI